MVKNFLRQHQQVLIFGVFALSAVYLVALVLSLNLFLAIVETEPPPSIPKVPCVSGDLQPLGQTRNVVAYGAKANDPTDDTPAFLKAISALAPCDTLYIPSGTYRVEKPLTISRPAVTIRGDGLGSVIDYSYEQQPTDGKHLGSLFIFTDRIRQVTVKNLKLAYRGTYNIVLPNQRVSPNAGKVDGLFFRHADYVTIDNLEVTGFNHAGLAIITGSVDGSFARNISVRNANFHHNRVAGILAGSVNNMSVMKNRLEYNGLENDGGTGYGFAGYNAETPTNVRILFNEANYNHRKGIDFHQGRNIQIGYNHLKANKIYGISVTGVRVSNISITSNVIEDMKVRLDPAAALAPVEWTVAGIALGSPRSFPALSQPTDGNFRFVVYGNTIANFGDESNPKVALIPIYGWLDFAEGKVTIQNNKVTAGTIHKFVGLYPNSLARPTGNTDPDPVRQIDLLLKNNRFTASKVNHLPFSWSQERSSTLSGNYVEVGSRSRYPDIAFGTGDSSWTTGALYEFNKVTDSGISVHPLKISLPDKTIIQDNTLNGQPEANYP